MSCFPADFHDADVAIYLDCGIDCSLGYYGDLVINERGMIFRSRWRFRLGTQLAVQLCARGQDVKDCPICEELTMPGSHKSLSKIRMPIRIRSCRIFTKCAAHAK